MAASRCKVTFTDLDGVSHAVTVDAESLYEAIALAVAEFRAAQLTEVEISPMSEFCVEVAPRVVEHRIRLQRVLEWSRPSTAGGPALAMKRDHIRKLLLVTGKPSG